MCRSSNHPIRPILTATAGAVVLLLAGCYTQQRVVSDGWAGMRQLADKHAPPTERADGPTGPISDGWAILLERFEGRDAGRRAAALARRLTAEARVPDVWIRDEAGRASVYRGHYPERHHPHAQQDLQQTRLVLLDEVRPYEHAQLVPLGAVPAPGGRTGSAAVAAWDARQFEGMFTFQIGFYDEQFGPEYRQAAERAVEALRAGGEEAYFYHGPFRSLVTVGLFTEADFVREGATSRYGPRMRAVQDKYPYNLGNGLTVVERPAGADAGEAQASFLVRIAN